MAAAKAGETHRQDRDLVRYGRPLPDVGLLGSNPGAESIVWEIGKARRRNVGELVIPGADLHVAKRMPLYSRPTIDVSVRNAHAASRLARASERRNDDHTFRDSRVDEIGVRDVGQGPAGCYHQRPMGNPRLFEVLTIRSAPSERFGCVSSMLSLAGLASGAPVLEIGSGKFVRPLARAAATRSR